MGSLHKVLGLWNWELGLRAADKVSRTTREYFAKFFLHTTVAMLMLAAVQRSSPCEISGTQRCVAV